MSSVCQARGWSDRQNRGGLHDVAFPPELMKKDIASQIPGARLIAIPGAAHLIALEKGPELATALLGNQ
jgi:pimeloyl-ACP methyl ester carboxylesterase